MKESGGKKKSCVRLHMYAGKDNLVINKTLLLLGSFFSSWEHWGWGGGSRRTNSGIFAKFCNAANGAGGNLGVNTYRMVFIQLN